MKRTALSILIALTAAGCAPAPRYRLLEPRTVTVANRYTVEPQIQWNVATVSKGEVWTVDGESLEGVWFLNNVGDGEAVFVSPTEKSPPRFKSGMNASEIAELFVDSLARRGAVRPEVKGLRPHKFGQAPGFRFEVSYVLESGPEKEGTVAGAVLDGRLYLIFYAGLKIHYFERYRPEVERLIASVQVL